VTGEEDVMAKTVLVEVPEELAGAVKQFVQEVEEAMPETRGGRAVDVGRYEQAVEQSAAELEQQALRRLLQALDIDAPRVVIHGERYTRVGRYEAPYETKAGPVRVLRSVYRKDGERNSKTVDAVSLRAGVVEDGWLPSAARAMAFLLQQGTSREAEKTARELGRLPYSRSSFERVGHAVGALYEVLHAPVEDTLIEAYEVPTQAKSISVGLDRVSVPMEEPARRPVGRPRHDAPKRPIERNHRQAYVGTVTLHDEEGHALHTVRYGRMPQGDAQSLCAGMGADVAMLLRKRPDLQVERLSDGAPEMHHLLVAEINEEKLGTPVDDLVDFWHLLEKLAAAAEVLFGGMNVAHLLRWKLKLLNTPGAVWQILTELRESGKEQVQVGTTQPVHEAITYVENNGERMNYADARQKGLPIGSGNTEATCKSLITVRMKRAGSRWKEGTGSHIVYLRALALSDRWDDGISLALRELRTPVRPVA
jgi:hypothetical protein